MNKIKLIFNLVIVLLLPALCGCATIPAFQNRAQVSEDIASKSGFKKEYVTANDFYLLTYQKFNNRVLAPILRVYIEGDGHAWKSKYKLSDDPTPLNPLGLRLAVLDPSDNVAYIARPGQFLNVDLPKCDSSYWSKKRFAPEVVEAMSKVIDALKEKSGASAIELVGYSGGGALAVLVAAARSDVVTLRTVAGNLDIREWSAYHHVSQLYGSLNPLDVADKIAALPQRHFVGGSDKIVPGFMAQSFVEKMGDNNHKKITVVRGATHGSGWIEHWVELLKAPLN
ncbi:MAG: alpha/beta hydrolase [Candidatus Omnitrophica bacterium]|nr:alpha/beta hydrolase [Candidatus Omnitrophota bacterium]